MHQRIERRDEGAHRQPVDRRRRDDRQLAHAGQRQLQRARDRRRRQRQHMDLGAQLLQPLLVGDAEMLLLVDDEEAEVLERRSLLPSSACVPTTMSIVPSASPSLIFFSSGAGHEAATACATLTGSPRKRSREGLEVLARQQRRRHHDRDLLAVHRGDEGGAQRHLGLAEADVAADQPVHRPAGRQVVEHRVDGVLLVLGLLIGEARRRTRRRGPPAATSARRRRCSCARGGDLDQLRPPSRGCAASCRALRACQAPPPSRSSWTSVSSEP